MLSLLEPTWRRRQEALFRFPLPTMLAGTAVTINGIAAPLYYVSPIQLNVQIPYEVTAGTAILRVNNNGRSISANFNVASVAPAIFTFNGSAPVPFATAARGQLITLYITGAGPVTPVVATGSAPAANTLIANLPTPATKPVVTVGGASAAVDFAGIPAWWAGVVQINYTVPANAPLGAQPVVVSIGAFHSAATTLTITQ